MTASGRKDDQEKPRVDLLDAEWLEEVGRVLSFGARKYAAHNWRGGISISRLLGAVLRHTFAIMRGEDIDPESGLTHAGHLSCSAMFLFWMLKHRKDLDDRYVDKPAGESRKETSLLSPKGVYEQVVGHQAPEVAAFFGANPRDSEVGR